MKTYPVVIFFKVYLVYSKIISIQPDTETSTRRGVSGQQHANESTSTVSYVGKNSWKSVLPFPTKFPAPTTPFQRNRGFLSRRNQLDAPHEESTTPLIVTSGYNQSHFEDSKVSMKLTVLEAEIPSKIIAYPSADEPSKIPPENQPLFLYQKSDRLTDKHRHLEKEYVATISSLNYSTTIHQNVGDDTGTPEQSNGLDDILENDAPVAAKLQQSNFEEYDLMTQQSLQMKLALDERLVCQVHRCDDSQKSSYNEVYEALETNLLKNEITMPIPVDFMVSTEILRDIFYNHVNADLKASVEIVDVDAERKKYHSDHQGKDQSLFQLGLGTYSDPALKPPPVTEPIIPEAETDLYDFFSLQPQLVNESPMNSLPSQVKDLFTKMGEHGGDLIQQVTGSESFLDYGPQYDMPPNTGYGMIPSTYDAYSQETPQNSKPWEGIGSQYHNIENIESPETFPSGFPDVDILSTKMGILDGEFSAPVSHQLPPSVLPSIHEDAKEGRIVQSGSAIRIVLRMKPSAVHPTGQILSLPASKFNEFGNANLVLDNGQKVSVRIKHESTKNKKEKNSSHFSKFFITNEKKEKKEEEEIPITILRDGKTGTPIMALPGLKPKKEFVVQDEKEKQLPETNLPLSPTPMQSPFVPPTDSNDLSSSLTQGIDSMRSQIRQGFRNFMSQFEAIPQTVQTDTFTSFDSSMDFLRSFYGNFLPESYIGDSMTVLSMAAFAAFLGGRVADIANTLTSAGIGRRALEELQPVLGREVTGRMLDLAHKVEEKLQEKEYLSKQTDSSQPLRSSLNQQREEETGKIINKSPKNDTEYNFYEDLDNMAKIVNEHMNLFITSHFQDMSCLQKELCLLSSAGAEKGGLSALVTPIMR